ncbi:MAG TPA: hypothetical protein DGD08_16230 [Gemmatimonas aurantiaca]|uniref:Alginate export domain-containing protein n=2 Tax=Gemmatimonas aurantiaca TaxID=173480 RepID=C1A659_GEMAT|nr:hypothetical protein [Gemmatimonas aurantiaca]BAH37719.1 hypothetical protein GAU_0677 [Gemmatimonas aurantiaca T-27]HCT58754.1 hypothetical protein [Gemmatimonas aurantiaca]
MTRSRFFLAAVMSVALSPLGAQTATQPADTSKSSQRKLTIQYLRPQDQRGINMFETPKVAGAEYNGFAMQFGAAFAQQFQGLTHQNTADSVFQAAVPAVPGNAGTASSANKNRLMAISNGFNNATANLYMHAQLARGVRIQLTSYLSARHHNETWVKDGFIQIDESPIDIGLLNSIMKYTTVKIGHFEVNYGDFHFKRSDNGQALYNPLVGNAILDAFTTEVGAEAIVQHKGLLGVFALTNGEIRGNITRPADRSPAVMAKLGFDRQLNDDVRVRLTGSWRNQGSAISNTLYAGDRAGSRYYFVMENYQATESAQQYSGNINPGFSDKSSSYMINPFVKVRGLELFGMVEKAKGRAAPNTNPVREVNQYMAEATYRFLQNDKLYLSARWNRVDGDIGGLNNDIKVTRGNAGAGWFIAPTLLLKGEFVNQTYDGFARTDIRNGGKFKGFMLEAVTAF